MSWFWNPGQRSLKVIENGAIQWIGYVFLLVFYSNFVPKMNLFDIFDMEKCRDLEIGVKGHSRSSKPTRIDPPATTSY